MKNFKLLLATTAILSTALAMNVKAENEPETATMQVHVGIALIDELTVVQDIDFGTLVFTESPSTTFTVDMNPASGAGSGIFDGGKIVGGHQNGRVSLTTTNNTSKTIQLPEVVVLRNSLNEGLKLAFTPQFTEIDSITGGYGYTKKTFGIGGTLTNTYENGTSFGPGEYTGELTITAIADLGE